MTPPQPLKRAGDNNSKGQIFKSGLFLTLKAVNLGKAVGTAGSSDVVDKEYIALKGTFTLRGGF
jgi:hypothetical protein